MSDPFPTPAAPRPAGSSQPALAPNTVTKSFAAELRAGRVPFVMATVVRAERPTSAKAGDVAVVLADGTVEGFVGGECAEASVRQQALEALATGQPILLRISAGTSPAAPRSDTAPVTGADQGVITVLNPCLSGGTLEIFLEPDLPPQVVVIHGSSPIAHALASLAEHLGYAITHLGHEVELTDPSAPAPMGGAAGGRAPSPLASRQGMGDFAGAAAVVVASHGRDEEAVLEAAVRAEVPYIGLVASRKRGAAVLERLDVPETSRSAIHTPAGLDLGARKPQEIALSILAEIVSSRPRRTAGQADTHDRAGASATSAIDPVCGMTVAVVSSTPTAEHAGEPYYFCGFGCRDAFVADPADFHTRL